MPILGAIGNASEYSFRGTYDNYPFDIDFVDLIDAEPGQTYVTALKLVNNINYKVPISITGDGEYYIGNLLFDKTFDNEKITFDQTSTTFDSDFPQLDYTSQPGYIRNKNIVGLRIFGIPPVIINDNLIFVDRSLNSYNISLAAPLTLILRDGSYSYNPKGKIQIDSREFQGTGIGIGTEYYGKTYSTTITIGKKEFTWLVKTKQAGSAKNLSFSNVTDAQFSTNIISNTYTVQGLTDTFNYIAEFTSSEGFLSINYGQFVRSSSVKNGDIIRLSVTSSVLDSITKTVDLKISHNGNIGSATTSWNVTTLDSIPSNLVFTDNLSAELSSEVLSNIVRIDGLSNNISFNVEITSVEGLLSINGGPFVKSTTIRNGDEIQLKINTSAIWLEQKVVTVKLANTSTTWNVKNRTIAANSDSNASSLIYALPFNSINQVQDVSPEVRVKSSLSGGLRASSSISIVPGRSQPSISTDQSRYYGGIGSLKLAKGTTTKTFETTIVDIATDSTQSLGFSNFTAELWMRFSGFSFGGEAGMSIFYPSYIDNRNINDYFFQLFVKGDNWVNTSNFRRGLLLGYPDANGVVQTICETTSQVLSINSWNHVAVTRNGNTFTIWVNGSAVASGSRLMDLTSTRYNFAIPNFQRLTPDDVHIQDLRLYKGIVKYTSNFNPTTAVNSILEPYNPSPGSLYTDSAGRILILSCATALKDPRTLTKVPGIVLPGTDTCIDDTRWQNYLNLASTTSGYRLAVTSDSSTTGIIAATSDNIRRMINANVSPLRNSLTDWQAYGNTYNLAWDETSGATQTGSDYSILYWDPGAGFGYYGQSSNPFFDKFAYFYPTANWWILPPGVPDF